MPPYISFSLLGLYVLVYRFILIFHDEQDFAVVFWQVSHNSHCFCGHNIEVQLFSKFYKLWIAYSVFQGASKLCHSSLFREKIMVMSVYL